MKAWLLRQLVVRLRFCKKGDSNFIISMIENMEISNKSKKSKYAIIPQGWILI